MSSDLACDMAAAARELRQPAGPSEIFQTREGIQSHRSLFLRHVHSTWKRLHFRSLEQLMIFDSVWRNEKKKPLGHGVDTWAKYTCNLWRRINDSIVWTIFGEQRHIMKQLCLHRLRGPLSEANPESLMTLLDYLNSDLESVAIWNDATLAIDHGDITYSSVRAQGPAFLEVKEGEANRRVLELQQSEDEAEYRTRYEEFVEIFGTSGVKQLQRFERQSERFKMAFKRSSVGSLRSPSPSHPPTLERPLSAPPI